MATGNRPLRFLTGADRPRALFQSSGRFRIMTLPTAAEINVHDSLDERHACENFLGKSVEEAEVLFRENALFYQEDLMWMGPVAFRFYVESVIRYIQSDAASGDSDAVSCFATVLEFRLEQEPAELVSVGGRLASICGYIIKRYERFDLAPEIYGDVRVRFRTLQQAFLRMLSDDRAA
jgi:hypothetical protein